MAYIIMCLFWRTHYICLKCVVHQTRDEVRSGQKIKIVKKRRKSLKNSSLFGGQGTMHETLEKFYMEGSAFCAGLS